MNFNLINAFLLAFILIAEGKAQVSGPVFKPGKMETYYPNNAAQWELHSTTYYTYNQAGKEILKIEKNAHGIPLKKDSLVYEEKGAIKEAHSFAWSIAENRFVNSKKDIYCINDNGSCGELNYRWSGSWDLYTGTESLTSFSDNNIKKTQIHRYFDNNRSKWFNSTKTETILDESGREKVSTYYSANHTDNNSFDLSSRVTINGWLDYENKKHTEKITEEFFEGKWVKTEVSTMERVQTSWVEIRERFNEDGSRKETYRIVNNDDERREVYLKFNSGWLLKSDYTINENEQVITENHFKKDTLLSSEISRYEIDSKGNIIKATEYIRDADGTISDFFQMDYLHTYSPEDLLIEQANYFRITAEGPSSPSIRKVYSEHVLTGNTTSLAKPENRINFSVYPNPGTGLFYLTGIENAEKVSVLNGSGIQVCEKENVSEMVDLSDFPAGIYFMKITKGEESLQVKVVVK